MQLLRSTLAESIRATFAFHLMKNKESTTALHYNVLSDQREAIRLAMYIDNTSELGGETVEVTNEQRQGLIDGIS